MMIARLLLCIGIGSTMQAQPSTTIPDDPSCPGCRIERTRITTLRDASGSALIGGSWPAVTVDSRGRFYVVDLVRSTIAVFGADGRLLRTIGQSGSGPGEFRVISRLLVTPGDSLHVFDMALQRETVLSPEYATVRQRSLPGVSMPARLLSNGDLVVNLVSGAPDLAGLPLHVIDSTGTIIRSFGSDNPIYRAGFPGVLERSLAVDGHDRVYAARNQEYVIELWNTRTGDKVREYARDAPWFQSWVTRDPLSSGNPPHPGLFDGLYRSRRDGLLWVLIQVADTGFRRAIVPGKMHELTVADDNQFWDTIVEVLDPIAARVLTRQRFDDMSTTMFGDHLVFTRGDGSDGQPEIRVWKLRVAGSP
jgi:hypothetical protein